MTLNEIVVGLDDSPSAEVALRWGAEQAIRRQTVLRAIHVFDWPYGSSDTTVDAPVITRALPSMRRRLI
jgi:Universal stress protein family